MLELLGALRDMIMTHCTQASRVTSIQGLTLFRSETGTNVSTQVTYAPMVCLIAQGCKEVTLGDEVFKYDAAKYLVTSVDLPIRGNIRSASKQRPYLALSLALDLEEMSLLPARVPAEASFASSSRGLAVLQMTPEMLEAFVRLLRLLGRPAEIPHLAPLIVQEILYRLMTGPHSSHLRQVAMRGSQTQQVIEAVSWIRRNYAKPFRMTDLLDVSRMSAPSLHRHFKALTAMSPLQYQKQIRLQEARRLLVTQGIDASTAAFAVGYESPSQFSREYARHFGVPPRRDAGRLSVEDLNRG